MSQKNNFDLSDFLIISPRVWKEQVLKELKMDSEQGYQWQTQDININAFYTGKDLEKLQYLHNFKSNYLFKSPRHWYTREIIEENDVIKANLKAIKALDKGADAIAFKVKGDLPEKEIPLLLKDINISEIPIHLYVEGSSLPLIKTIQNNPYNKIRGSFIYSGKKNLSDLNIEELASSIESLKNTPDYRLINIDSLYYTKEMGAVKEVAYSISLAIEYLDKLSDRGLNNLDILKNFEFSFSMGKNYFPEIAKLRAFRFIWHKVTALYNIEFNAFASPIHCHISGDVISKEESYKNIFHHTTGAMAAIVGGCDSLSIEPFDNDNTELSTRISRNISLILKSESYFNKIVDPGAGSYYIEQLTNDIIEKAWAIVIHIERQGGFTKAWEKSLID